MQKNLMGVSDNMKVVFENSSGRIIHGDNLEVMQTLEADSFDSCVSDLPYAIDFMQKSWDSGKNFYSWCNERAKQLIRILKPGGYAAIFGHPKTNHRMKCAFEDAGFNIVEEIDWVYCSGMPKNQDIGKLFDKSVGAERIKIGMYEMPDKIPRHRENHTNSNNFGVNKSGSKRDVVKAKTITAPTTDMAKKWDGWKTSGIKPAHEPITIFQKPLEGTYVQNIEKYGCGGMNIDACRVPISQQDIDMLNAKASKNPAKTYSDKEDKVYGKFEKDIAVPANEKGRFPSNMIFDEFSAEILDEQKNALSRLFPIIKYNTKVSPSERKLGDGTRNPHVTLKPVELISWLIRLLTPYEGKTIDITAGSCTHAVACEKLNHEGQYHLNWVDIELMNTEKEPYCKIGIQRVKDVNVKKSIRLF